MSFFRKIALDLLSEMLILSKPVRLETHKNHVWHACPMAHSTF